MLQVKNLGIYQDQRWLWRNFNLQIAAGEVVGIQAPSGYGKTTLGRVLAGWQAADEGEILYQGQPLPSKGYSPIQLLPQHPEQTFNPVRRIADSIHDAWHPPVEWLERLAIDPEWLQRRPDQLSGGELARLALLRALGPRTKILIADEATAQLDSNCQALIWHTILGLCREKKLSLLVFCHDNALMTCVCQRVIGYT